MEKRAKKNKYPVYPRVGLIKCIDVKFKSIQSKHTPSYISTVPNLISSPKYNGTRLFPLPKM